MPNRLFFYILTLSGLFLLLQDAVPAQDDACSEVLRPKFGVFGWRVCAFDIDAEAVFLCRRDDVKNMKFTSQEIGGDIVLSSRQLDFGWIPGWRLTGEIFFDTCDRIELTYLSMCEKSDTKTVTSENNDLYSILSSFGTYPYKGYKSTDEASLHSTKYSTTFYTWEANYRNHLSIFEIPCFCRLDGAFLYGYRYFNFEESLEHYTESTLHEASMDYTVDTSNTMHGLQVGAEGWFPFNECLDLGFEIKAAYYFNSYDQKTKIVAPIDLAEPLMEEIDKWGTVWGVEGSARLSYELCSNFYIRAGYLFLYLDDLALATRNFNHRSPFQKKLRDKKIKNTGCVTYHGATAGIDICW